MYRKLLCWCLKLTLYGHQLYLSQTGKEWKKRRFGVVKGEYHPGSGTLLIHSLRCGCRASFTWESWRQILSDSLIIIYNNNNKLSNSLLLFIDVPSAGKQKWPLFPMPRILKSKIGLQGQLQNIVFTAHSHVYAAVAFPWGVSCFMIYNSSLSWGKWGTHIQCKFKRVARSQ